MSDKNSLQALDPISKVEGERNRSYPRVLIIGQHFDHKSGGGITLSNLFSGWDKDKIAVACRDNMLQDEIATDICTTYYQLGINEHQWLFPFNLLKSRHPSGLLNLDALKNRAQVFPRMTVRKVLIMKYLFPALDFLGLRHSVSKVVLSDRFLRWLDEFKPELLYVQPTSRAEVAFCIQTQAYLGIPLVFHIMDDWPTLITNKGFFKQYWRRKIDRELKILLDKASVLMSVSDYMSEAYQERYGKHFLPFHNPVHIDFWKPFQKESYELPREPTILYAGRTGLGIDSSLKTIAQAVESVNKEQNWQMKFVLQTPAKPGWIKNYGGAEHRQFVAYPDLPGVFAKADFLILPYDFSADAIQFIKYSMPTKASEYMACGTPILIFAPEETALVKYAKKNNWALVVTKNRTEALSGAIKRLVQDKALRQEIALNALKLAENKHNSVHVSRAFKTIICSVVRTEAPGALTETTPVENAGASIPAMALSGE